MKYLSIIALLFVFALPANAQEDITQKTISSSVPSGMDDEIMPSDSLKPQLHIPTLSNYGTMPSARWYPYMWGGWHTWDVHEGLNASLGASVFSTFGSGNTYSGAGFAQNISLIYAKPLTEKFSIAVGGYFSNVSWWHSSYRNAGVTAVLGYQFDQHWSAYLYAQKNLTPDIKRMPLHLMDMNELGDRIGAAVRYTFNPNFSIQVSFETNKYNSPFTPYFLP